MPQTVHCNRLTTWLVFCMFSMFVKHEPDYAFIFLIPVRCKITIYCYYYYITLFAACKIFYLVNCILFTDQELWCVLTEHQVDIFIPLFSKNTTQSIDLQKKMPGGTNSTYYFKIKMPYNRQITTICTV